MSDDQLKEDLEAIIEEEFRCYNCNEPTSRYIRFATRLGIIEAFECLGCRKERVQAQVDAGLRPASDLDILPENR